MYKKKLGVRVITAITVGSLLSSNLTVAMASEQASQIIADAQKQQEQGQMQDADTEQKTEVASDSDAKELVRVARRQKQKGVTMNIQFKDGDEVVAGGDYTVPEGVQNYSILEQYVPEGYQMTVSGDFTAEEGGKLVVSIEKVSTEVTMNIQFKDGDEVVAGGDYTVPEGVQNYSVLEQYVPAGYRMTVSGDFTAEEGGKLVVSIEKVSTDVTMNIQFKDGDEVVAGGDYTVPEGVQNYSVLEQYVPEGYRMTVSGDFMAEEGSHLDVSVEKIGEEASTVVMNIRFVDGNDTFIAGGDYFLPEGVQNYSILNQYVPEGYHMMVSGDFMVTEGGSQDVHVEKDDDTKTIIMNIQFKDGDEVVAGGDYFVPEGVQNYSVLEQYVPEGYRMTVSGDFMAEEGSHLDVNVEKITEDSETEVIMNIRFVDGNGTFIAGGDYFLPEGVQNYSILNQYVPEGYHMMVSGDFMVTEGGSQDVHVEKDDDTKTIIMNIQFKDGDEVVAGGDYFVPEGVQNYSVLEQYVPEGYRMTVSGDFMAEEGSHLDVNVEKITEDSETEVIMNIRFVDGNGTFIAGGDYFLPEGVQNYSILEKYVPEGYHMMVSGDFMVTEGGSQDVHVEKTQATIINVTFADAQGNNVGGGDYFVDEDGDGIFNYSELDVPEGYKLVVTGDAFVSEFAGKSTELKVVRDGATIINVTFVDAQGNNVGGGDYFVDEDGDGIFNYSELDVPEGYKLVVTGDAFVSEFVGKSTALSVERDGATIINVTFVDAQGNNVGGGDYFVDEDGDGIFNYSELDVPEGYKLVVTGDAFVSEFAGKSTELKVVRDGAAIVHVQFIFENEVIAGGDYFVDEDGDGIFNYSELEEYVPEGYRMTVSGDVFVSEDTYEIYLEEIKTEPEARSITVEYFERKNDGAEATVGTETVEVDKDAYNLNTSILTEIPDGYELVWTGDIRIDGDTVRVEVRSTQEGPEEPDQKVVTVIYQDEAGNKIDEEVLKVDFNATSIDSSVLNAPEGYEIVSEGSLQIGADNTVIVLVKASEPTTPEEETADAILVIHYMYNGSELSTQTVIRNGKVGESHMFSSNNVTLQVPDGYHMNGSWNGTEVPYGERAEVTFNILKNSSGSGSGSGGSSGGGARAGIAATTQQLVNGTWILDSVGWWYQYSDNSYAQAGWYALEWQDRIDWYYFDETGYLVSGWFEDNGATYFLHDIHDGTFGRMYTGWNKIGDQWYLFNDSTESGTLGALVEGAEVPAELLNQ